MVAPCSCRPVLILQRCNQPCAMVRVCALHAHSFRASWASCCMSVCARACALSGAGGPGLDTGVGPSAALLACRPHSCWGTDAVHPGACVVLLHLGPAGALIRVPRALAVSAGSRGRRWRGRTRWRPARAAAAPKRKTACTAQHHFYLPRDGTRGWGPRPWAGRCARGAAAPPSLQPPAPSNPSTQTPAGAEEAEGAARQCTGPQAGGGSAARGGRGPHGGAWCQRVQGRRGSGGSGGRGPTRPQFPVAPRPSVKEATADP